MQGRVLKPFCRWVNRALCPRDCARKSRAYVDLETTVIFDHDGDNEQLAKIDNWSESGAFIIEKRTNKYKKGHTGTLKTNLGRYENGDGGSIRKRFAVVRIDDMGYGVTFVEPKISRELFEESIMQEHPRVFVKRSKTEQYEPGWEIINCEIPYKFFAQYGYLEVKLIRYANHVSRYGPIAICRKREPQGNIYKAVSLSQLMDYQKIGMEIAETTEIDRLKEKNNRLKEEVVALKEKMKMVFGPATEGTTESDMAPSDNDETIPPQDSSGKVLDSSHNGQVLDSSDDVDTLKPPSP